MTTTTREQWNSYGAGYLPGHLGVEFLTLTKELVESRMAVGKHVMAPNGYLHARAPSSAVRRRYTLVVPRRYGTPS